MMFIPGAGEAEGVVGAIDAADAVGSTAAELGQAGENAVREVYDIGDKELININGRDRIPDGINAAEETLSEVKNVANQSFTQQLRDYLAYAQQNNMDFNLFLRADTEVSGPLQDAINDGLINRIDIPF
jgi:hypothetical protein